MKEEYTVLENKEGWIEEWVDSEIHDRVNR
jgi:hypothetical protein